MSERTFRESELTAAIAAYQQQEGHVTGQLRAVEEQLRVAEQARGQILQTLHQISGAITALTTFVQAPVDTAPAAAGPDVPDTLSPAPSGTETKSE